MSPRGAATLNSLAGVMDVRKILWAKWRVGDDGQIDVIATYAQDDRYAELRASYGSLEDAAAVLGPSFRDVVNKVLEAGIHSGRWRP